MGSQERGRRIREKYEVEQKHIQYLLNKGLSSLEIAEQMLDYMVTLLREGIKQNHPEWDDRRVLEEMRKAIEFDRHLQKKRGLRQREGN